MEKKTSREPGSQGLAGLPRLITTWFLHWQLFHCNYSKQLISTVIGSSFYQLCILAKIKHFLTDKTLEMAVHAFITSRLDYCNSLYCGISKAQIARLQLVQNAASRFLLKKKKRDHATPLLKALHWLPVEFRIRFKILLFVFKSLHNQAPGYQSELLHHPLEKPKIWWPEPSFNPSFQT